MTGTNINMNPSCVIAFTEKLENDTKVYVIMKHRQKQQKQYIKRTQTCTRCIIILLFKPETVAKMSQYRNIDGYISR